MLRRLLCLLAFVGLGTATISDCGAGATVLKLTDLAIQPATTVSAGETVYLTVKFDNPGAPITDGTVKTSVTLNYIPLSPSEESLCTNTQCPLESGPNDRSTSSVWPAGISGKVDSKIEWFGVGGEKLLCIKTTLNSN